MVERFNGRIAEVLATRRYDSAQDLETTLLRYVWLYNHHLPQKALGHRCPMDAMKQWYAEKPHLFTKIPRNRPGPDTYGFTLSERRHGVRVDFRLSDLAIDADALTWREAYVASQELDRIDRLTRENA